MVRQTRSRLARLDSSEAAHRKEVGSREIKDTHSPGRFQSGSRSQVLVALVVSFSSLGHPLLHCYLTPYVT